MTFEELKSQWALGTLSNNDVYHMVSWDATSIPAHSELSGEMLDFLSRLEYKTEGACTSEGWQGLILEYIGLHPNVLKKTLHFLIRLYENSTWGFYHSIFLRANKKLREMQDA